MRKPNISFFFMNLILLFIIIGFILIVFELHRFAFVFELGILLVFMFFIAFGMFALYENKRWGWTLLGAVLILLLLDTFFIYVLTNSFETAHLTVTVFSIAGITVAFLNLRTGSKPIIEIEEHEKAKEYYPYIDKMEPEYHKDAHIEKTFTPGKFLASKKANKFHAAKCDWAKRISKENQVWFNSREEAESQGLEADRCVS